jgi:hypothetical protein
VSPLDPQPLVDFLKSHLAWVDGPSIGNNLLADVIWSTPPLIIWKGPALVRRSARAVRAGQQAALQSGADAAEWLSAHRPAVPTIRSGPAFRDTSVRVNVAAAHLTATAQLSTGGTVNMSGELDLQVIRGSQPAQMATSDQVVRLRGLDSGALSGWSQVLLWPDVSGSSGPSFASASS